MGRIYEYLADDHARLDGLLERATGNPAAIDMKVFAEFRRGLLRHIGLEEKIILPAIARLQNGKQTEVAARLRLDHGALTALLVPTPSSGIIETILSILEVHNSLEEKEDGLYQLVEKLVAEEANSLLEKLMNAPEVLVLPHNDRPGIHDAARRAVGRAGYKPAF